MPTLLSGMAASSGIAIAKAYRLDEPILVVEKRNVKSSEEEIDRFEKILHKSNAELKKIREKAKQQIGGNQAAIFDAHLLVLGDPEFLSPIVNKIKNEKINAEYALQETVKMFVQRLEQSDNLLIRERIIDIYDVKNRLLSHLLGVHLPNPSLIMEEVILIAKDLSPSDTAQLNPHFIKGVVTERGANSSHSAIIASALGIPAVVGMKENIEFIEHGDVIIIDGFRGQVHINPTTELVTRYKLEQVTRESEKNKWHNYVDKPTVTKDGLSSNTCSKYCIRERSQKCST